MATAARNDSIFFGSLTLVGISAITALFALSSREVGAGGCQYVTVDGVLTLESSIKSCNGNTCRFHADGSSCTWDDKGEQCFKADGTSSTDVWMRQHKIDWTCRDANGNITSAGDGHESPPPPSPSGGGSGICKDGETTFDGCNSCTCSGGNWLCTTQYCPEEGDKGDMSQRRQDLLEPLGWREDELRNLKRQRDRGEISDQNVIAKIDQAARDISVTRSCIEQAANSSDLDSCDTMYRNVEDLISEIWDAMEGVNLQRNIKDTRNSVADMERNVRQLERDGMDVKELKDILATITAKIGEAERFLAANDTKQAQWALEDASDLQQDYWDKQDTYNQKQQAENTKQEIARIEKEDKRNMERQIKEVERSGVDVSELKRILAEWEQAVRSVKEVLDSDPEEANYRMQGVWDANGRFWDTQNVHQSAKRGEDLKKEVARLKKEEKRNMERQIKELERAGVDTSALKQIFKEWEQAIASVEEVLGTDTEEADYRMQDVGNLQNEFWSAQQSFQSDRARKELEGRMGEECKEFDREAKRIRRDLSREDKNRAEQIASQIEGIAERCRKLAQEAKDRLARSDEEPWEIEQDLRFEMDGLWQEFQGTMESIWEGNACRDAEQGIADASRSLEHEIPQMIAMVRTQSEEVANALEKLHEKAQGAIERGLSDIAEGDCEGAFDALDTMNELGEEGMELMEEAGISPDIFGGRIVDYEDEYNDFYDDFASDEDFSMEFDRDAFVRLFGEQGFGAKDLDLMRKITAEVLEQFLMHMEDFGLGGESISYFAEVGADEQDVQALIREKNALLEEITALRDEVQQLRGELQSIVAEIAQYNFGIETAKEVQEFVREELPTLDPAAARTKVEEFKLAAREEKYEEGFIPFKDTDDDAWYTLHAARAKEQGLVTGTGDSGGTKLDPGRSTNLAEAVALFARVNGIDEDAEPHSSVGRRLPEWAWAAGGTLEARDINLDRIFGSAARPDKEITRAEAAQLLFEVFDEIPEVDPSEANVFRDIAEASPEEKEAIAAVREAGIMTGNPDETFDPQGIFNRAALVKVLNLALEEYGEEDFLHGAGGAAGGGGP